MSEAKKIKRLIVMPAHNESKNIVPVLEELKPLAEGADILVVDDYSSDNTADLAASKGAKVIRLPCNLRYGGAVQTGFKYAVQNGYDVVLLMDADGQHDPRGIPALLEAVESGRADVALGSRIIGRLEYRLSGIRRAGMALFAKIVYWATGQRFTDPTSGFQALNAEVVHFLARDNYPSDFPDADLLILLIYAGFRVTEVPVTMRERMSGESMHRGSWRPLYYVFKMLFSILIVLLRQRTHLNAHRPHKTEAAPDA